MLELMRTVRIWPHRVAGEGHFIALLRNDGRAAAANAELWPTRGWRAGVRKSPAHTRANGFDPAPPDVAAAWEAFARQTLATAPAGRLLRKGEQVYLAPEHMPDLGALQVVRVGLWLGTLKPGRFEPSHALALALLPGDARHSIALPDAAVERYLRGETFADAGPDGWALVAINGWPLGWGRRVGGVVKNFYPKGLRRVGSAT